VGSGAAVGAEVGGLVGAAVAVASGVSGVHPERTATDAATTSARPMERVRRGRGWRGM
jgi:hypothetical protein